MFKKANMEYRPLGNSGLMVSAFSYGNWLQEEADYEESKAVVQKAL